MNAMTRVVAAGRWNGRLNVVFSEDGHTVPVWWPHREQRCLAFCPIGPDCVLLGTTRSDLPPLGFALARYGFLPITIQHRDTQETLTVLDTLDLDTEKPSDEEIAKRFGYEDDYFNGTVSWWQRTKPKVYEVSEVT